MAIIAVIFTLWLWQKWKEGRKLVYAKNLKYRTLSYTPREEDLPHVP